MAAAAIGGWRPPEAWHMRLGEIAEYARQGRHCEIRRCREPVTVHVVRSFRQHGTFVVAEHFVCSAHGDDFSRRYHAEIRTDPRKWEPEVAVPRPTSIWRPVDGEALAALGELDVHCSVPRCPQAVTSLTYSSFTRAGRPAKATRFACDAHAASFAHRHGIEFDPAQPRSWFQ